MLEPVRRVSGRAAPVQHLTGLRHVDISATFPHSTVKEALAAMRRKRAQASQDSTLSSSPSSTSAVADPFLTPAKGDGRPASASASVSSRAPSGAGAGAGRDEGAQDSGERASMEEKEEGEDGLTEVERRFNLEAQGRVIAKAKKTG